MEKRILGHLDSSRSSISCHIPFPHIWFPSQCIRLPIVASDVCLPACMDRPPDADMHILSLAIGTRTRRSDHHPGLRSCLSMCNHRNEKDSLSLRIDCLSICSIGRVSSCPLYTCLTSQTWPTKFWEHIIHCHGNCSVAMAMDNMFPIFLNMF